MFPLFAQSQAIGDYRTNATTLNWNATASWQRWDGATWVSNPGQGFPGQNAGTGTVTIQAGHTVTLNVSPTQAIGTLIITSTATLTSGAQTLLVTGNFENNGGTFTPGSGTVTFNGTTDQAITGTVVTQTFNNITVNKSSGALSVSGSTTTVVANGSIILTSGTFNAPSNLNVGVNFTNNGGTFVPGAGTVTFTGSGAQAINGSAPTQTFNVLVINKSGGTLTGTTATINATNITLTAGTFAAGANTNVGGDFTINGGTFTPGGNTVTFNGAGAQAINGTLTPQPFNNVVIQKTAGTLSVVGAITLNIAGNFTNNASTVDTGVSTIAFVGGATHQINGTVTTQTFNNLVVNKSGGTLSVGGSTGTLNVVNFTRTAGTFTAPATMNVTGNFVLTAGIYNAGVNTNIGGDFTNNGGTFAAGGNTVTFNGAGAQAINGSLSPQPFANIVIAKSGGTLSIVGAITLNVTGNWTNNNSTVVPGVSTVNFNGTTGPQQINGTAVSQTFNNLTVNKSGTPPLTLSVGGSTTTIDVATLTLTAGTFNSGTNTNITADFVANGGTFSAGTNTVTFSGAGAKSITGTSAATTTFFNVEITGGTVLFGSNSSNARTVSITNNLTVSAGSLLSGPTASQAHTINLTGNLVNNGTMNFSDNGATAQRLIFTGAGAKTLSGTGSSTVHNLGMSTVGAAPLNINTNLRVNGTLDWTTDGLLILGAADVTFGGAALVTAPTATRYIRSDGTSSATGQVIKISDGTTASWQFLFPIGTTVGGYSPVNMTAPTTTITNAPTINSALAAKAIIGPDEPGKLKRVFRLRVTGNGIATTTFTNARFNYYSPTDVSGVEPIASYNTFWYQRESNGIWTRPGGPAPGVTATAPTLSVFTAPASARPLVNDTYYFTIGTPNAYGTTWYSYQSGNWSDPTTWTTDGSSFPLYVNPAPGLIPGPSDDVVIKSGQIVTMDINNAQVNSINVIGTLNVAATTGHQFTDISGTGRIRIAGAVDNFPGGAATNFADVAVGGTLEINGANLVLNVPRTFKNVVVNMNSTSSTVVLKNNLTVNGDLTISQGLFQFEDAAAPANRTLTVNGHTTVAATGGIRVASTNNRHEFDLFGDFVNNGTAYFTNRVTPNYAAEATDGIVDVNFRSSSRDQLVACNGVTRFYRLEINKGSDDTYTVSLSAADPTHFALLGFANQGHGSVAQLASNVNALGLIFGTVEIGSNVAIPVLSTDGNYNISVGAQLWINGGTLNKNAGNSLVPYGRLRVTSGVLTANVSAGITTRDGGSILVEGGSVTTNQIRTSVLGSANVGSYTQSGGTVTVDGGGPGGTGLDFYVFSLTYPGNVFNMSGGDLIVRGARAGTGGTRGAIYINSDPGNISVTGGRVIFEISNGNVYRVTSRAPFWNVLMRRTAGAATVVELNSGESGTGGGLTAISSIQPLQVLNDLVIESPINFVTNNADVVVSGNFEIQNGATYTPGTNTTTMSGGGVGSLIFGDTTATQVFNNLTINKASATNEVVVAGGRPGPVNAALQVNGTLSVLRGIFDYGAFVVAAQGNLSLANGVSVGKTASIGRLLMNGAAAQSINSSVATIHNLELNNTNNVTLTNNNLTILGTLTLTNGVFDIGIYRLTIGSSANPAAAISGSGFGSTKMIRLAGNASDDGLELYLDANETLQYPIGTNAGGLSRYTPVTAVFQNFSDDGFVRISLGDAELPTSNGAAGANTILSYYWRVQHTGFTVLPRVTSYTFNADNFDDPDVGAGGLAAGFVPGKVLDVSPFTRSAEVIGNISSFAITFNGNTGSGATPFNLEAANYTAGTPARFTGSPTVYYSRSAGATGFPGLNWHDGNSWSFVSHTGPAAGSFPTAGSIAIIGSGNTGANNHHSVNVTAMNAVAAELIFVAVPPGTFQSRLTVQPNRNITFGRVSGPGTVMIRVNTTQQPVVTGDFGDFALEATSQYNYTSTQDAVTPIVLPTNPTVFPNLRFEGGDAGGGTERRMTIPADIIVRRNINIDRSANFVLGGNVTVTNDVLFNDGTQGRIEFPSTGANLTFSIGQDLLLRAGGGTNNFVVNNTTPSSLRHRLQVGRNITISNGNLTLFNGTGTANNATLEVNGTVNGVYTNTAGTTPSLFRLVVNKGNSVATTFTLSNNMTLNGPFDGAVKPLELQNGLLVLNNATIDYTLTSGGGDFRIPGTAGLEVRLGAARTTSTSTDANIVLDGLLRVSGGTVDINGGGATDSNFIQYTNSGNASIDVTAGTLTVAGQVRRDLTSATGILRYSQSGGTVLVGNEAAPVNLRGVFEVLNPGSQFNHSGGSFTIVRGNGSATVPSFWLEPGSSTVTAGSTITLGNGTTPAGTIGIQSIPALNNLTIAGAAANTPQISLYTLPLTVTGNVIVATGNTLNALGRDLTIGGNFTVNGTYTSGTNTTIFNNTAAANIGGALSVLAFHNFTKTGSGVLTLARDISIGRDLRVSAGELATGAFSASLLRHAEVDATISSTSGSGLIFAGTSLEQRLTRSASGTGTLGIVTINNPNGVIIPDGNGYDFAVTNNLRLQSGVFDIGGSLLSLGETALITPVNPFSGANLIQTNSSFTDKGVRKRFPLNYTTDFVFPVGQSNYTPVTFNFGGANTTGTSGTPTITIRPTNRAHPVIVDGPPAPANDTDNVLQYYWIVSASGISNTFRSTMTLQYTQPLVAIESGFDEELDYIAARILTDPVINPTLNIQKFSAAEVDAANNRITFSFATVNDQRDITGDYFAGVDPAIPSNVRTYTTVTSGNVGDNIYNVPVLGGISGSRVIVSPGHNVTFNTGSVILYQTVINSGAQITIPSGSIGNSLGTVSGTGNLAINSDDISAVLPAAEYDTFFSCAGGGLIFGGSGSYEILGGIIALRNLTLNGIGDKSLANNDVTICEDLTINNGALFNSSNRAITVQRDVFLNNGTINNSAGTLTITRDFTQGNGAFNGGTGGTKTIGRNLVVNGGTFTPGSGTTNLIRVNGNMTVASGATIVTGLGGATGQRFLFGGTTPQVITGSFTGGRAFNRLEINNSAGLTLVGNVTIANQLLLTNGLITPTSGNFLLDGPATVLPVAGSATSFVNGKLFKTIPSVSFFEFPIGKGSRWRSGGVLPVQAGVTWDMEYFGSIATGVVANAPPPRNNPINNFTSSDASVLRLSGAEYWRVSDGTSTSSGRTAIVGLSWGIESDVSPNFAEREAMKVMSWNGTNWTNHGGELFSGGHTQSRGTFRSLFAIPFRLSFSENIVTLGSTEVANPLPIELSRFEARLAGTEVELFWQTASETGNDFFEIHRSIDGVEYETLGRVKGAGTTSKTNSYFFGDPQPRVGMNYYRLKQVDFDGASSFSEVRRVAFDGTVKLALRVHPNPTALSNINFRISGKGDTEVRVRLLDLQGRTHFQRTYLSSNELIEDTANLTGNLPAGVYLVEVVQGNQRVTERLVIR